MDTTILAHPDCETTTLYTLALIRTSIIFWERPKIKNEIADFFSFNNKDFWDVKNWHKITKNVLNLLDDSNIPGSVGCDIKDAILNIGVKTYDWLWYLHRELGLGARFAETILWTPLGFVDEVKIFKMVWGNSHECSRQIFYLACLSVQEEFIERHQDEMIEDLKNCPFSNNVHQAVIDCSDKIYGIISTYVAYFIHESITKRKGSKQGEFFSALDELVVLVNYLEQIIIDEDVAKPIIMALLCALFGLVHCTKYYYKKLSSSHKKFAISWCRNYCENKVDFIDDLNNYDAGKTKEILAFLDFCELEWTNDRFPSLLLCLCPLQSAYWPYFSKWLNRTDYNKGLLKKFVKYLVEILINDYNSGLPIKRTLFQRLLKGIWVKAKTTTMQKTEEAIVNSLIKLSLGTKDFTILRVFVNSCNSSYHKWYLLLTEREVDYKLMKTHMENFDLQKKFYDEMFPSNEDRALFFKEQFCKNGLLSQSKFDSWEKLYSGLNILNAPLRESIDPVKCLRFLAESFPPERCDKFVKWWHESEENRKRLKDEFKASSHLPECIYKSWVGKSPGAPISSNVDSCNKLLEYFFDSEEEIIRFKSDRLSLLGLLHASFQHAEENEFFYSWLSNWFHEKIYNFLDYRGTTPENISREKEVIRNTIENIMLNNLTARNVSTLNFLMDWISLTYEEKKIIFRKLNDSSKMLKLCKDVLHYSSGPSNNIFYNDWLKISGNVCELKRNLISICKNEKSEDFMRKISLIYEKVERGEHIAGRDLYFVSNE